MAPSFSFYKIGITLAILSVFLSTSSALNKSFYFYSCPQIIIIVRQHVSDAINTEPRMGASLLRLHFHDCFVNGCDGSVLLDDFGSFKGEKSAGPNLNSLRGFDIIDNIKTELELEENCPGVVSCADILALAAMYSVRLLGGPFYFPEFGRKDATTASQAAANQSLPATTLDLDGLVSKFNDVGLNTQDLIVLSGAHTIGKARCITFKGRIYNKTEVIDRGFAKALQSKCPKTSGKGDNNLAAMDLQTPNLFDNNYYTNLLQAKGLFHSDQQLNLHEKTNEIVEMYHENQDAFYRDFVQAMIKMGRISGSSIGDRCKGQNQGEIRINCRKRNPH